MSIVWAVCRHLCSVSQSVKKEGGQATQSAKDMKAQDAMKNSGKMKDEGIKFKDAATGK